MVEFYKLLLLPLHSRAILSWSHIHQWTMNMCVQCTFIRLCDMCMRRKIAFSPTIISMMWTLKKWLTCKQEKQWKQDKKPLKRINVGKKFKEILKALLPFWSNAEIVETMNAQRNHKTSTCETVFGLTEWRENRFNVFVVISSIINLFFELII